MSIQKYVSEVRQIEHNLEIVYNYLSNFDNLSQYINDGLLSSINDKVPQIKISNFESDQDSCRFQVAGMGKAEIRIVEREPAKTIKIVSSGGQLALPYGSSFYLRLRIRPG